METLRQKRDQAIVGMEAGVRAFRKRTPSTRDVNKASTQPTIEQAEAQVYQKEQRNPFILLVMGNVAAVKVFFYYLITLDTILACCLCVGLTLYWYFVKSDQGNNEQWQGGSMDW
jgi:Flp pilus assembly protein TadB